MPGDRLTSPEAAKESAERDVDEMSWNVSIAIRWALRQDRPVDDPGDPKQVSCQSATRFAALRRLFL